MYHVALLNLPFASLKFPSLALARLKSVVEKRLGDRVSVELLYLNHDFAHYIGTGLYQRVAVDMEAPYNGLGDWFFRQEAFPELADNAQTYFQRYFPRPDQEQYVLKRSLLERREGLGEFLDALIDRYRLDEVDLVGFTSMFSQNVACFALARRLKERRSKLLVVMGGANCETPMGQEIVKNMDQIDFVFSGSAMTSFPQFVQACLDGDEERRQQIPGVFSKSNHSTCSPQALVGAELPIDVPIELDYGPFLDALERNFPDDPVEPILLFETSRGCWWGERAHCTFCGLNGMTMSYRSMSPERARHVIRSLFKYSSKVSRLQCVDNIMPKSYPKEVFATLDTPANMTLFYEVKADLTEEDMQILSSARVKEVQPGIEALATSTLKLMRKGTNVFQNLRFLKLCVMYGIVPDWSLLVGFPGEGEEVYQKYVADLPMLLHLPPPSGVYPVRPDRFSPYQAEAERYGLDLRPADFYELVYPLSRESLQNLAYFFRDYNFGAEYFGAMVRWIGEVREKVEIWRGRWNGEDQDPPPTLHFDGDDPTIVRDSRTGEALEHRIGETGTRLLQCLERPRRMKDLPSELGAMPGFDPSEVLSHLRDRELVFQEGDQLMSLVLPRAPSRREDLAGWSWAT
jgi:ribosomal peptide maturation radical SAM protein 1